MLPLIAGYLIATSWPSVLSGAHITFAALALGGAIATVALSRKDTLRAHALWSGSLLASTTLAAATWFFLREPPVPPEVPTVPREASLTVKIERAFAMPEDSDRFSGIVRVTGTPAHLAHLQGRRLALNLKRTEGQTPANAPLIRSTELHLRGLLTPVFVIPESAQTPFDRFLQMSRIDYRMTRAKLLDIEKAPSAFQTWCTARNRQIQAFVMAGTGDSEPAQRSAKIAVAMLLGDKSGLSTEQKEAFARSGTMHLFAISGLHIGVIAAALNIALKLLRLPRKYRFFTALPLLILYVQIIGAPPSAVRATIMVFCFWAASLMERRPSPLSALLASACIVLIYQPSQLFATGFQPSYSVVAGILLYGLPLAASLRERLVPWRNIPEAVLHPAQRNLQTIWRHTKEYAAICLAATVFAAPFTILHFGLFSPGGFFINLLLVPVASLAIVAGMLSIFLSFIGAAAIGILFNHSAWVIISCMEFLILNFVRFAALAWEAQFRSDWLAYALSFLMLGSMILMSRNVPRLMPLRTALPLCYLGLFLVVAVEFT